MTAVNRDSQEEHPSNNLSRDTTSPRWNEEYMTKISVKGEGRVTVKICQEFGRIESWILGAPSAIDDFPLNSQNLVESGIDPGTSRDINR